MTKETIKQVQRLLQALGNSPGEIDGIWGTASQAALDTTLAEYNPQPVSVPEASAIPYPIVDGHYIIPKGANVRLSENLTSGEFDCHGVGCCTETKISVKLIGIVQGMRDRAKQPVTVSSGYRCPLHNSSPTVKGATGSRHCAGGAADIFFPNQSPRKSAQDAEDHGVKGIGLYESQADGFFVHVDDRESKSFWYGQGQAYRSTFK